MECDTCYCVNHQHRFDRCDVCRNGSIAEVRLGCYDRAHPAFLCMAHRPRYCGRTYTLDGDDEAEDEMDEDEDAMGEDEDRLFVCHFRCCKAHLDDHECGDDPTQYC
jgi:hypothetical protein